MIGPIIEVVSTFSTEFSLFFFFILGYFLFHYDDSKRRLGCLKSLKFGGASAGRLRSEKFEQCVASGDWAGAVDAFAELERVEPAQIEAAVRGCVALGRHSEAAALVQHGLNNADRTVVAVHGNAILEAIAFAEPTAFSDVRAALRDFGVASDVHTWEIVLATHAGHSELASKVPALLREVLQAGKCPAGKAYEGLIRGAVARGGAERALAYGQEMFKAGLLSELSPVVAVQLCKLACGKQGGAEQALRLLGSLSGVPATEAVDAVLECAGKQGDVATLRAVDAWTHPLAASSRGLLLRGLAAAADPRALSLFDEQVQVSALTGDVLAKIIEACAEKRNIEFAEHALSWATAKRRLSLPIFFAVMKVYGYARAAQKTCELYDQMRSAGVEPDTQVYSTLIRAAVACNRYDFARELFGETKEPEVQNYMALMRASAKEKNLPEALRLLHELERSPTLNADISAYNCALDACVSCGKFEEAQSLFERMNAQGHVDVISYNTLLKGLASSQCWAEVESLLEEMRARGLQPNCVTYNSLINAAVHEENMKLVWRFVEDMGRQGVAVDEYTCSILTKVVRLTKNREDVDRALRLIDRVAAAAPDDVFFSTLLDACVRLGDHARLKQVLGMLQRSRVSLSVHTCGILIKAFGFTRQLDQAWKVWYDMADRWGLERTEATYSCMLEACVQCGAMDDAVGVFRELHEKLKPTERAPSGALHTVLIRGFAQRKEMHRALQVYEEMKKHGVPATLVTFNTLIDACARVGDMTRASELFNEMVVEAVDPDLITYSTMIKGCCVQGDLERALQIFGTMQRKGIRPDAVLFNSILDGCAKRQMRTLTESVLSDMEAAGIAPSNITLSILVKLYGRCRDLPRAFEVCEEIPKRYGFRLNAHVYTSLMTSCISNDSTAGGLPRALQVFEDMRNADCTPDAKTYQTIAGGCLKGGDLHHAVEVVDLALKQHAEAPRGTPFPLDNEILDNIMFMIRRRELTEELGEPLEARLRNAGIELSRRVVGQGGGHYGGRTPGGYSNNSYNSPMANRGTRSMPSASFCPPSGPPSATGSSSLGAFATGTRR